MLPQFHGGVRRSLFGNGWLVAGALLLAAAHAAAQEAVLDDLINVSYIHAAVLGSGTYELRARRITMLKVPLSWKQRPESPESVGWRWLAPVVLGYDDLSQVDSEFLQALLPSRLVTLSVMPGVEFVYPVNAHWYLKPFIEVGGGRDFNAAESFALTHLGIRSLSSFEPGENWQLLIGGSLRWSGEHQFHSKDANAFGIADLGLDLRRNLPWRLFAQRLNLGGYYLFQRFLPRWEAGETVDWKSQARELHEFGLSLGIPHGRKIFGINVRRVRVGYKKGGKLQGWTFGTEFPF